MNDKIRIAQEVFNRIDENMATANGFESEAEKLLSELLPKVKGIPDAILIIASLKSEKNPVLSAPASRLNLLFEWAERLLRADPATVDDFPRWARHMAGMLPSRKEMLLELSGYGTEEPIDQNRKVATKLIDVADRLGIIHLPPRPIGPITSAELWNVVNKLVESYADPVSVDDDSHLSPAKIAELFGVALDPLRKRLERWRATSDKGWIENPDRTSRDAQYLYRVGSVRHIIDKPKPSSNRPAEKI